MDHLNRMTTSQCAKVFIQRDYSEGTKVKFLKDFPPDLEGKVGHLSTDTLGEGI